MSQHHIQDWIAGQRNISPALTPPLAYNIPPKLMPSGLSDIRIHSLLAMPISPFLDPPIIFDLSLDIPQLKGQIPIHVLNEPATQPPLASLILISPRLPWQLEVAPQGSRSFLTVADVLHGLYTGLRIAVSKEEYERQGEGSQRKISLAYYNRWERIANPNDREKERMKGVKRIDFLMGKNLFKGLSRAPNSPHIWTLHFA